METDREKNWYGVRIVYLFGQKRRTNVFEERICVFSGADANEAMEKAQRESAEYAYLGPFVPHDVVDSYLQDGGEWIDGYEVWSELYEFNGSLGEFVAERYDRFAYKLDWDDMPRALQLVPLLETNLTLVSMLA